MKFKNKEVAIVTGGNKGIGQGISRILAQEGARIVVSGRDKVAGNKVVEKIRKSGGEAIWLQCDVSEERQVKELMKETNKQFGGLDILVNNAGIGGYHAVTETTLEEWNRCMDVDLKGVFLCSKYAIPYMQKKGKGVIVNISSVHAKLSVNGCAAYDAAKGAVSALTRQMAIDYGPVVRVNDVSPGWVLSELVQGIFDSYPDPTAQRKVVEERQIMKRIGTPVDIGYAVAFLASDEASFITGAQLFVDGGLTCELERW